MCNPSLPPSFPTLIAPLIIIMIMISHKSEYSDGFKTWIVNLLKWDSFQSSIPSPPMHLTGPLRDVSQCTVAHWFGLGTGMIPFEESARCWSLDLRPSGCSSMLMSEPKFKHKKGNLWWLVMLQNILKSCCTFAASLEEQKCWYLYSLLDFCVPRFALL